MYNKKIKCKARTTSMFLKYKKNLKSYTTDEILLAKIVLNRLKLREIKLFIFYLFIYTYYVYISLLIIFLFDLL